MNRIGFSNFPFPRKRDFKLFSSFSYFYSHLSRSNSIILEEEKK